jgi:hypothetical protein
VCLDVLERQYIYIRLWKTETGCMGKRNPGNKSIGTGHFTDKKKTKRPTGQPEKKLEDNSLSYPLPIQNTLNTFFLSQILSVLVSFRTVVFLQRLPLFTTLDQTNIATRWIWWHSRPADRANQIKQPIIKANEQSNSKWKASYFT